MIKRFLKYGFFIVGIILLFISCERDDICPESTPTTPFLIIEFFDVAEPDQNKTIKNLSYIAENTTDTVFLGIVDSIALPLNTNQNTTQFQLIRNTNDDNFRNVDTIRFIYEVSEKYVNRACGFKAIFKDLSAVRTIENPASNNWIRSVSTEQLNVENEQNTHVFILH
ncbi:DUF6452 family protein [Flavobacterium sp. CS20]|jgi:hypothetical protein|uniref:DUF6452 family protein n=1 Tax=Flavobacterium sp. CS20 TaxID=2775246 RepID=UPI001B3A50BD|nr:DUF6452 family protein [Flavobacterium sp. CS20]QTY27432.1 hypothetical protein IGB25_02365 [Flavobacterium sp. CS20]